MATFEKEYFVPQGYLKTYYLDELAVAGSPATGSITIELAKSALYGLFISYSEATEVAGTATNTGIGVDKDIVNIAAATHGLSVGDSIVVLETADSDVVGLGVYPVYKVVDAGNFQIKVVSGTYDATGTTIAYAGSFTYYDPYSLTNLTISQPSDTEVTLTQATTDFSASLTEDWGRFTFFVPTT